MKFPKFLRLVFGAGLLFFLFAQLDTDLLVQILLSMNVFTFIAAVIFCGVANFLCALRWESLSKAVGLNALKKFFVSVYFESIAANCVLPGGILGGDIWRTVRLARKKKCRIDLARNDPRTYKIQFLKLSGLSVLLDRIHGFWSLCIMGISCFLMFFLFMPETSTKFGNEHTSYFNQLFVYLMILVLIIFLPILVKLSILFTQINLTKMKVFIELTNKTAKNLWRVSNSKKIIVISLSSQILFGLSFWICLYSIGVNLNIFLTLVLVPGIFLFASIPIAIAGFGPREAGSLIFLMPLSLNSEHIFISSVLFGLTSTILGVITLLISLTNNLKKD